MARKLDILAPNAGNAGSVLMVSRWLKNIGDPMLLNEPIAELMGSHVVVYVHAPAEGNLSSITAMNGQNILSGAVIGQVTVVSKDEVEWDNFDQVTEILEEFADKANNIKEMKDANEALGQLLGVSDNQVFLNMSIEQQNKFIQNVVDQHQHEGLSPAAVAQKLLEGLSLRMPAYTPGPVAPSFGLRGPGGPSPVGPGGVGGGIGFAGVTPQQQQGYAPIQTPGAPWPAQQGQPIMPQQGYGYPPHGLPPTQPQAPYVPPAALPPSEDENKG